jgi:hypothetical protein
LENVRKRASRDVEQAHKFALERVAHDLIGVKDSLELGLANAGSVDGLREGTKATLQLLSKALEKAGLIEIVPQGEQFNPELHEAMMAQPSAEHVPNSITQVVQKLSAQWPAAAPGPGDRRQGTVIPTEAGAILLKGRGASASSRPIDSHS